MLSVLRQGNATVLRERWSAGNIQQGQQEELLERGAAEDVGGAFFLVDDRRKA
jgi:hypothetical protein